MSNLLKRSLTWGLSITTTIFTFVPDSIIGSVKLCGKLTDDQNLFIVSITILIVVFLLSLSGNGLYNLFRRKFKIWGRNYCIHVEYGNLFKCKNCQRVISFDECFSTKIGTAPHEIKAGSICGQYLTVNSNLDVKRIVAEAGLKPEAEKSQFNNQERYMSGSIAPNGDDLLLAFAMLDKDGRGHFPTRDDYLKSLAVMWSEIHKHYQMKDVCIPVLGGGLTTIGDATPTQQELVDLIIESYKLSAQKIKKPRKLRIICRKQDGISLSKVGDNMK